MPDVTFDGETVTATNRYLYDSLDRLIVATGRQNASNGPPDPKTFLPPSPPNATAVRNYQQRYGYDAIGNLLAVQQLAKGAGWTRDYAFHTETKADGKVVYFDSRLLATTVGLDTRKYAHDAAGNLTSLGDDATLAYDARGLLQSVALAGGNSAIYRYDAGGGRVCKHVDARQTVAVGAWEGSGAVGEDGAWTRDEEFIAISDGVSVVLRVETSIAAAGTSSAQRFELADQVNSRTVYLDGAGGVLGRREYQPYGAIALQSWSGTAGGGGALRWGFGDKRMDGETGLLDFGARMYAPWLGRWTACDPVVDLLGSAYGYCRGSPVSLVDPDGRDPLEDGQQAPADPVSTRAPGPADGTRDLPSPTCGRCIHPPSKHAKPKYQPVRLEQHSSDNVQSRMSSGRIELNDSPPPAPVEPKSWNVGTRAVGALRVAGGFAEATVAAALLLTPGGITQVAGALLFLHAADTATAGATQAITGHGARTMMSRGVGAVGEFGGMTAENAEVMGEGVDLAFGMAGTLGAGLARRGMATTLEAGAPEAGGAGYDFALGLSKHPDHARSGLVGRFSEHVGGKSYWDLFDNTTDMRTMGQNLLKGMRESKRIHFNLDGMIQPGTTIKDLSRWGSEGIGQGNVTNWELHQILSNSQLRSKATFYLGGKPVDIGGL